MKNKFYISLIVSLFLLNCNSPKKELIDIQTITEKLSLFGEHIVSTPLYERDIAISPNNDEIIYTLGDYKQNRRCLVSIKKQNKNWGEPEVLNISGKYQDIEPFYSNKGNRLYFASNRPIYNDNTRTDYNIWYSDKFEGVWSKPIALDSIINSREDEFFPSLSKKGNIYFTSTRENGIGREDIFISKYENGAFKTPTALPSEINTPFFEFNAFISPNEDYIIFSSFGRDDGFGGGDLYVSQKDITGKWTKSKNMGAKINSDKLDFCPFVDWKSRNFYFTSERITEKSNKIKSTNGLKKHANSIENGFGNIYKIGFKELNLSK